MSESSEGSWWRHLTGYHWFVYTVATAAWTFDCLDQRLFSLARVPALAELSTGDADIQALGKIVTATFLIGWGVGGLVFGALGDRYGRAKMLTTTVLIYSVFTGLTFFSQSTWDFALFRFLTGVGVGGVFGLAVALIAETVPDRSRAGALGTLQILSAFGNIAAVGIKSFIDYLAGAGVIEASGSWRWVFLVGAAPAFLVIFTQGYLREPEPWLRAKEAGTLPKGALLAPYAGLVQNARWRRNLIIGAVLASAGVIGLWAIGEYAVDVQKIVFRQHYENAGVPAEEIGWRVEQARSIAFFLQMTGAAIGMWAFTYIATALGRRPAFALAFTAALVMTAGSYWFMNSPMDAYWMMPLMAAAQLSLFAGYAIYLPELFPSQLRSTGTSFCYNLGRFGAAGGSFVSAWLATQMFGAMPSPLKERCAALAMCTIFLLGLAMLPFAPETKGKPLPE